MKSHGFMRIFTHLRLRTRLAFVMFLTMACMSAALLASYVRDNRRIKALVATRTSDLATIIEVSQQTLPQKVGRTQALDAYMKTLEGVGLSSVTLASPTGEVLASTTPGQIGTKIKIRKHRGVKQGPVQISAELRDVDVNATSEQRLVQFPIIQGKEVIGYAQVRFDMEDVEALIRQTYLVRLWWIMVTMFAGIVAVVYLAFLFSKPVDTLVTGARQVAQGNLYVKLPVTGSDEMGRLAETFNQMVERLRETRQLQERLNDAEKMSLLGRFAGTVAHEVRNSLNFINLSIDQIRAKHSTSDERAARELQRNILNVKEEVSRLNRLVNDFLAAGRQAPPALALCDLRAVLGEATALVEKQAHVQDIRISTDVAEQLPQVMADTAQMKTCFLNILTNAIQAMPRGGEIRISARPESARSAPAKLVLRFADTGPGILPEDRERIFAPYFSTKTTGFGLGLAITRKIVEDHGGRIYVTDSKPPGTVMVVELPLRQPEARSQEPAVSIEASVS